MRYGPCALACALLPLTLGAAGCDGIITQSFDAKVRVNAELRGSDAAFSDVVIFDSDANTDIRDNRDRIVEGSGTIRSIRIEIVEVGSQIDNRAKLAWGEVCIVADGEDFPPEGAENADATFEAIPILLGQDFQIDIPPSRLAELSSLIFQSPKLKVKVRGWTNEGPVSFNIRVTADIEFQAG